ncbi:MAG: GNAT family N-acetyltransferase [Propionibacteriaceae bacterium]|jgi:[ribosomal protein S5]-alanine N-acetyltransferase|uniref:GNAT family N-acetyltransferase n=1 Tax=Micropruina glycogenica TaxID=75385 RepID=A0A2N9JMP4_9ACTN|nr:GNAT family protein [Micropruina glycogenica]MCB0893687.1 GNAT family N-acetyltransferase [Propionibacteriaceae bacterium]SPD88853.1 GNAT family N-acetyltransferase [Micropruina glycogenica]
MTTQQQWPVELSHGPVTLRPWRLQDRRAWNEIRQRNAAWTAPWDSTRPPDSIEPPLTFAGMVRQFNRRARLGQMLPFAVDYRPDGQAWVLAGQLTISGITHGSASWAQAGYWVDQRWAGRGIIPTALALAVDHCFFTLHLHRMEVAIRPENVRSLRVVEKLGFRHEGSRARYMHVDGDWRDHEMFALHADEVGPGLLARLEHSA